MNTPCEYEVNDKPCGKEATYRNPMGILFCEAHAVQYNECITANRWIKPEKRERFLAVPRV